MARATSTSARRSLLSLSRRRTSMPNTSEIRNSFKGITSLAKIVVGPGEHARYVPKEFLTSVSTFFNAALNGAFAEGLSAEVKLPEDRIDVFDYFLFWLYTRRLDHEAVDAVEPTKPAYFWLLHLYCLVDKLGVEACKNAILDKLAQLADTTNSVPTPTDTWIVFETFGTTEQSSEGLRRLVVDLFAWKRTDNLLDQHEDEWHPRFMRDLCVRIKRTDVRAADVTGLPTKPWIRDMCQYHEHSKGDRCDP